MVVLLIISGLLCLFVCIVLIAPMTLEIDTERACAVLYWVGIGHIRIWHEEEWWLSMRVLFYRKTIAFSKLKKTSRKVTVAKEEGRRQRGMRRKSIFVRLRNVAGTLRVTECRFFVDTGDFYWNARLFPLNFVPNGYGQLNINFYGKNSLFIKVKGRPWKMLIAFLQ